MSHAELQKSFVDYETWNESELIMTEFPFFPPPIYISNTKLDENMKSAAATKK